MLISCWNRILSSCKEAGFVIITRPDDVHSEPNPAVNSKGSIGWCLGRGLQCGRDSVRTGVDGVEGSDAGVAMNLWTRTSQQHLLFVISRRNFASLAGMYMGRAKESSSLAPFEPILRHQLATAESSLLFR